MKKLTDLFATLLMLMASCGKTKQAYVPADSALDAGREFIDACLKGDFERASFYMLKDATNEDQLQKAEQKYRGYDRDGREQLRQASINIREINDVDTATSIIYYNNSFDQQPLKLKVVQSNQQWLVDFKFTFNPNM